MSFTSYSDFRNKVILMMDGENTSASIGTTTVDLMISLAEDRIYLGGDDTPALRASTMEEDLSVAVASNLAPLPADFLELKEAYFPGRPPLDVVPLSEIRRLEAYTPSGGNPAYVAVQGDSLRFFPLGGGTVLGTYYKKHEPLISGTWANQTTLARYPMVFLYAAVAEVAAFLGDEAILEKYEGKYRSKLRAAMTQEQHRVYSGSPLRMRSR